jgi:cell division protein FtsL
MKIYTEQQKSVLLNKEPAKTKTNEPKKIKRLTIFFFVVISSIITVIYVSNVISIDALLKTNQDMKRLYEALKNENDLSRLKLNTLQAADRITQIASAKLGMIKQETSPEYIIRKVKIKE